jgi:hypothetical protein
MKSGRVSSKFDLVGHEGGDNNGDFCCSLTVTDIATGWTEVRSVRNKAARHVFAALVEIQAVLPFPLLGIDSDNGIEFNGIEFINDHLLRWCVSQQITFTRSRPANKNDSCHVEQKNWDIARRTRRLLALRHRRRAGRAEPDLAHVAAADQPVHRAAEAGQQDPDRRQGDQALRHSANPLPAAARPP